MFIPVTVLPPSPNMNSQSRREETIPGSAEKYSETAYKQTPEEHQALLDKYKNVKGMPPALAIILGEEEEKRSPRYWLGDQSPRYGGNTPSSSFIAGVNVSPGLNMATITMKNGRSYSYAISPDEAGELTNANSLGAWYNKKIKLGKSKIPVSVTVRSGNRIGPAPIVLTGSRNGLTAVPSAPSSQTTSAIPESLVPMIVRGLGEFGKLIKP